MTLTQFKKEASVLSVRQRAALASALLHSLPDDDYDVSDEEVALRSRELKDHLESGITLEQLTQGLSRKRR